MPKKILLVDDDKNIRSLLTTLLQIEGFEIVKNSDLSENGILAAARSAIPDFILLDVHLNGVDGIDILKSISAEPTLAGCRVIMSSGLDLREKCREAGASDFLMKPYMPSELLEIIK